MVPFQLVNAREVLKRSPFCSALHVAFLNNSAFTKAAQVIRAWILRGFRYPILHTTNIVVMVDFVLVLCPGSRASLSQVCTMRRIRQILGCKQRHDRPHSCQYELDAGSQKEQKQRKINKSVPVVFDFSLAQPSHILELSKYANISSLLRYLPHKNWIIEAN